MFASVHTASTVAVLALLGSMTIAQAGTAVPPPDLLSPDLVAAAGTKAECVSKGSIVTRMLADQVRAGGKTIVLTDGADQDFADRWRLLSETHPVPVKTIMAHGFVDPDDTASTLIDVVEFDPSGCAISQTMLRGETWDAILDSVAGNHEPGSSI